MTFALPDRSRFARHRQIAGWDQERLAAATVLVAGCGALGNEAAKNLALLGVGRLILVDFDRIEESNLVRSVLFRPGDVGRPKAAVAAERLADLHPEGRFVPLAGDLWCDVGLGLVRAARLAVGCLDSVNARFALNRLAMRAGTPWLDGGLGVAACQVARYDPRAGACYECHMTPEMSRRFAERFSCAGLARQGRGGGVPTTAVSAALAGALLAGEAVAILHGQDGGLRPGQRLTAQLAPYRLEVDDLPGNPDCCAHGVLGPVESAGAPHGVSARDLLGGEEGAVELGFELVTALVCVRCGPEAVLVPRPRLRREDALCPGCGNERAVDWVSWIESEMSIADRPLHELGVPAHHVVRVHGTRTRDVLLGGTLL
ncbi:MAG: ThiF family adenylyltransferase [Candidatus Sericytochromatia bacterium]|nr:ThiF family adenylyltransferase [Candidatus Tanganyikabacteria bacterium]